MPVSSVAGSRAIPFAGVPRCRLPRRHRSSSPSSSSASSVPDLLHTVPEPSLAGETHAEASLGPLQFACRPMLHAARRSPVMPLCRPLPELVPDAPVPLSPPLLTATARAAVRCSTCRVPCRADEAGAREGRRLIFHRPSENPSPPLPQCAAKTAASTAVPPPLLLHPCRHLPWHGTVWTEPCRATSFPPATVRAGSPLLSRVPRSPLHAGRRRRPRRSPLAGRRSPNAAPPRLRSAMTAAPSSSSPPPPSTVPSARRSAVRRRHLHLATVRRSVTRRRCPRPPSSQPCRELLSPCRFPRWPVPMPCHLPESRAAACPAVTGAPRRRSPESHAAATGRSPPFHRPSGPCRAQANLRAGSPPLSLCQAPL